MPDFRAKSVEQRLANILQSTLIGNYQDTIEVLQTAHRFVMHPSPTMAQKALVVRHVQEKFFKLVPTPASATAEEIVESFIAGSEW